MRIRVAALTEGAQLDPDFDVVRRASPFLAIAGDPEPWTSRALAALDRTGLDL